MTLLGKEVAQIYQGRLVTGHTGSLTLPWCHLPKGSIQVCGEDPSIQPLQSQVRGQRDGTFCLPTQQLWTSENMVFKNAAALYGMDCQEEISFPKIKGASCAEITRVTEVSLEDFWRAL